jgi:hypothetical protein
MQKFTTSGASVSKVDNFQCLNFPLQTCVAERALPLSTAGRVGHRGAAHGVTRLLQRGKQQNRSHDRVDGSKARVNPVGRVDGTSLVQHGIHMIPTPSVLPETSTPPAIWTCPALAACGACPSFRRLKEVFVYHLVPGKPCRRVAHSPEVCAQLT